MLMNNVSGLCRNFCICKIFCSPVTHLQRKCRTCSWACSLKILSCVEHVVTPASAKVCVKRLKVWRLQALRSDALNEECHGFQLDFMHFLLHVSLLKHRHTKWGPNPIKRFEYLWKSEMSTSCWLKKWTSGVLKALLELNTLSCPFGCHFQG